MELRRSLALTACIFLSSCGGSTQDETIQTQDSAYQQSMDAGSQAFALERYSVAERSYREAARLALRRDDAGAIGDASYNLAVTQLAAGNPTDALATVQNARNALMMRQGREASAVEGALPKTTQGDEGLSISHGSLNLVAAAADYRLNRLPAAAEDARLAAASPEADIALRGAFIRGLVAAKQSDGGTLSAAISQLQSAKPPHSAVQQADLAELQARQVLPTQPQRAIEFAANTVVLRRNTGDYHAMARALALEGQAARATGQEARAKSLFAQASQSLGANGGSDVKPGTEARDLMNESGRLAPIQPFTSQESTQ